MVETQGLSGTETLLRVLAHMGVDRIFASPGSEWSPVWEALAKARAQSEGVPLYISSRHEEIAVGMASGYAKASRKLAAVMIHTTVGSLHATMALRGALHEQVPMVVFTGESVGFGEEEGPDVGAQWLGHLTDIGGPARLVDRCVKWSFGVNAKALLPATVQRACQLALAALGACQEHHMPILIVLFNNYGYLSQKAGMPRFFPDGFAVRENDFVGVTITPSPDYALIARAFEGYGEKVEDPGEIRAAVQRGLKAVSAGQLALIDIRLASVLETTEAPDRAN